MGQNGGPYTEEELGYMEQEEEWEREGLLDPAWEKQQKKVSLWKEYFFRDHYLMGLSNKWRHQFNFFNEILRWSEDVLRTMRTFKEIPKGFSSKVIKKLKSIQFGE